jgi:hypothetical protein
MEVVSINKASAYNADMLTPPARRRSSKRERERDTKYDK